MLLYGVTGDAVNVASSVMGEAAPGETLIGEDVPAFVHREPNRGLEEHGLANLRGKPQPLRLSEAR